MQINNISNLASRLDRALSQALVEGFLVFIPLLLEFKVGLHKSIPYDLQLSQFNKHLVFALRVTICFWIISPRIIWWVNHIDSENVTHYLHMKTYSSSLSPRGGGRDLSCIQLIWWVVAPSQPYQHCLATIAHTCP